MLLCSPDGRGWPSLTLCWLPTGSTAEGKLQPGDQLVMINSTTVHDLSVERAAGIIRCAVTPEPGGQGGGGCWPWLT